MKVKYILLHTFLYFIILHSQPVYYVTESGNGLMDGTSWENAFPGESLQTALYKTASQIWIAKGVYKPNSWPGGGSTEREKHFSLAGWSDVYGGFAGYETDISQRDIKNNETILSGDIGIEGDNTDNCYHVLYNCKYGGNLDGCTITGGNANGTVYPHWFGGGFHAYDTYEYTFRNCTFRNNYASDDGGAVSGCNFDGLDIFQNCLFIENEAPKGGAISSVIGFIQVTNCTFVNNSSDIGSVFYFVSTGGYPTEVYNNIFWGNHGESIYLYSAYTIEFAFNAFEDEDHPPGFGNITLSSNNTGDINSPYFTDPVNNDFSLQSQSPCIDTGVFWNASDVDITNLPRPQGKCRDIGAYEYESAEPNAVLPTVSTFGTECVSISSALCTGGAKPDGGAQLVTKGIIYSTDAGFDPDGSNPNEVIQRKMVNEFYCEGSFSVLLAPLEPNTTYYFRAYAENMIGGVYGEEMSFTTMPDNISPNANGILHVKENGSGYGSSWADPLNGNDLQLGINNSDVEQIWIAKGTYRPTRWPCSSIILEKTFYQDEIGSELLTDDDFLRSETGTGNLEFELNGKTEREKHFMLKGNKALYGGFAGIETSIDQRDFRANETILSGDIGAEGYDLDNAYHVIYHYYNPDVDSTAVLDGFTVSGGYADYSILNYSGLGGGMFNYYSSPTIRNCRFEHNYAIRGGAMFNAYSTDEGRSESYIYNTFFSDNSAYTIGGAICNWGAAPYLKNCAITNNHANYSGGGIFHYSNDCAVFGVRSKTNIVHCTIAGNTSNESSQIAVANDYYNELYIYNSVFWGSDNNVMQFYNPREVDYPYYTFPAEIYPYYTYLNFCAVTGGFTGEGDLNINLSTNNTGDVNSPCFTDPSAGDYTLQYNSAIKDMALYKYKTETDILGVTRPQGAAYDIGAYEFVSADPAATLPVVATISADSITASTAVCHSEITDNGGSPVIERGIMYLYGEDFNPEYGIKCSKKGTFSGTTYSTIIYDLMYSNVKYCFCSYAMNHMGYSFGEKMNFTSLAITPDADSICYVTKNGTGSGSSWSNSLNGKDIQAAIKYYRTKQLWIAQGKYVPTNWPTCINEKDERRKHFSLKNGFKIYGGFSGTEYNIDQRNINENPTILSGDIGVEDDYTDNCYSVIINNEIESEALLDGLVISGGYQGSVYFSDIPYGGAGIRNYQTNLSVNNCVIENNSNNYSRGGGIYNDNNFGDVIFNITVDNCIIRNNLSRYVGGGFYNNGLYYCIINNSEFYNNTSSDSPGAAIADLDNSEYSIIKLTNCIIRDNHSYCLAPIDITYRNWLDVVDDYDKITNCTIVNNTAELMSSGLYIRNNSLVSDHFIEMTNNVIFNNGSYSIYIPEYNNGLPEMNNCASDKEPDFEYEGSNNIIISSNNSGDPYSPYFSDPDSDHWWIQEASPLHNAGVWTDDVPLYDLVGYARDGLPDIGCYEFDPTSIEEDELSVPYITKLYQNYPNPFNPSTNIKFSLAKEDHVELTVYNIKGQLVDRLVHEKLKAGHHSVMFKADHLNSGVYYYTLKTGDKSLSKKMLIVK